MEKYKHLNSLIMNATITGESDCTGPITIYHKKIDRYLFVLVEEYTGDWYHRIFVCDKDFRYERGYILEPIIGMESPRCVYDCFWNIYSGKTELRHFEKGDWVEDIEAKVRLETHCDESIL